MHRPRRGATAPKWQRLEAICEEFIGAHPPGDEHIDGGVLHDAVSDWLEPAMEWLEKESAQWSVLDRLEPVAAPVPSDPVESDPWLLDAELRRLAGMRDRWGEVFGHLAMLFRMVGLWRDAGFASFGHYCAERVGMAHRTVEQRIWLERRLYALPVLRQAVLEGRVSYEKARLVAGHADDATLEQWIGAAAQMTCIDLRRKLDADDDAQMCARRDLDLRVPVRVRVLLETAFRAARTAAGGWLSPGECLRRIAQHFIGTWAPVLKQRSTPQKRVVARDGGFCQVPGCSRAAAHVHHVVYRSLFSNSGQDAASAVKN